MCLNNGSVFCRMPTRLQKLFYTILYVDNTFYCWNSIVRSKIAKNITYCISSTIGDFIRLLPHFKISLVLFFTFASNSQKYEKKKYEFHVTESSPSTVADAT